MGNKIRISKKAVRRESCRVAAAFGVRFFRVLTFNPDKRKVKTTFNGLNRQQVEITWIIDPPSAQWVCLYVFGGGGEDERYCMVDLRGWSNFFHIDARYNEVMARGLYCLGLEDESVLAQLPPLSAHEKLELRLSLPREFWPQKWVDEEHANY